ncbi:MAG: hypothetical protein EBS70_01390 [Actinobacteria bacterium]|jgi:hypothetical protein|nr:hypothetical protein [Actinomycetota bacterium]NBY11560.1 hypothetical protein [Actinomycetota bacterium]NCZ89512.1 hypothetical protein [Actinomycetota bacterium]NCZ92725.1 hypothetical protein [Actinomycetota bacterium]NDC45200.1 hypothetical protein [Actinomycetota bacterium]
MADGEKSKLKHKYGRIDFDYAMHLATRPPEEDGPIYMVNLMKYHEVAQYDSTNAPKISGREADDRYNPASILNKIGASIVFVADVVKNHVGDEDWDRIAIVRYATRKSFIEMQERKDFAEKHEHKAAGMQRTTIVCCRPLDPALDDRPRPTEVKTRRVVMVVRQTDDRPSAFSTMPGSTGLTAEGTIIGDGRKWDTVQFVLVDSDEAADATVSAIPGLNAGESYAMTLHATLDSITQ